MVPAEERVRPLLRAPPLGLCVAAMTVMLRDTQTNEYGTVSYSDLGGFKYLCAAYSLVSAFYTLCRARRGCPTPGSSSS